MNSQLTPLGVLIRTLRQNKGTTLYRMAKAIDLSPAQICAIEFGRAEKGNQNEYIITRAWLHARKLARLARASEFNPASSGRYYRHKKR